MTAPAPAPERPGIDVDDLDHLVCCDPDTALCDEDVSGEPFLSDGLPASCPMCRLLAETPCPACGRPRS